MLTIFRSLTSSLRNFQWIRRRNTNEEQNEERRKRTYPQSYPMDHIYVDDEKWQMCSLDREFTSQIYIIMAFNAQSALIKNKDDMVYGVGANPNGRLGLPHPINFYGSPKKVDALCEKNITSFHCSSDEICFYALTKQGEVYCWGINKKCRLEKGLENISKTYTPFKMDLRDEFRVELRITQIACNNYNCLALTHSGKVYIWGTADFANDELHDEPHPVRELEEEKIVQIACGTSFVMALTNNGKLYSWGQNKSGQLGLNSECAISTIPCLITSLKNVQIDKIVCGLEHSLALTSKGKIYSWGNNSKGQLGLGERITLERKPTMLKGTAMGFISDIAAQYNTSVAINNLERVYVWGFYDEHKNNFGIIWKPIRIEYREMYNIFRYKIPYIICPMFDDQLTSDFTIEVEGKCIYVHKSVLIRCEYFKNMFQDNLEAARNNTITYDDFSYKIYKVFLKYLYNTDEVDHLSLEEIFELLKLCDKCTQRDVAEKCIVIIKENLNVSNVALCFAVAIECNEEDLVEDCLIFSSGKMANIIQSGTLINLSKELILDFLMRAADAGNFICGRCALQL